MTITAERLLALALDSTGMDRARWDLLLESLKDDAEMNRVMREDWKEKPRDTDEAVREYYRESGIWFVNTWSHGIGALVALAKMDAQPPLSPWQTAFLKELGAGPILDYGGGFFKDTWPLAAAGHSVSVAEIEGPVTRFLRQYITLAGLEGRLGIVEVRSETPVSETYGGVVCFETLEHVRGPVDLAKHLHDHLRPGGPFAFSVSFGAPSHAPYHIAHNSRLGDPEVWSNELRKIGLIPCWKDDLSSIAIWKKVP